VLRLQRRLVSKRTGEVWCGSAITHARAHYATHLSASFAASTPLTRLAQTLTWPRDGYLASMLLIPRRNVEAACSRQEVGLMSTTVRNLGLATTGESSGAARSWTAGVFQFVHARPGITAIALSTVYLIVVAALSALFAMSMVATPIGAAVIVLFATLVVIFTAVGIWVLLPERGNG
jgi:hypothetical protein